MPKDWFAQNAPAAPPAPVVAKGGDWFAANAPKAEPPPDIFQRAGAWIDKALDSAESPEDKAQRLKHVSLGDKIQYAITGKVDAPGVDSNNPVTPGDFIAGNAKNIYEVSAPNVFHQLYKHATGQPNNLTDLPEKGAEFLSYSMLGGAEDRPANAESPKVSEPAARVVAREAAGTAADAALKQTANRLATKVIRLIPGAGKLLDLADLAKEIHENLSKPPEPAPAAAPPSFPQGPPEMWGQNIPQPVRAMPPPSTPAPFRRVPGEVPQDIVGSVDTRTLPNGAGVRTTPIALLPASGEAPPGIAPRVSVKPELDSLKVMKTTPSGTRMVNNPDFPVRLKNGEVVKGKSYDLWEDKAIEDAAREDLAMHGRHAWRQVMDEFRANNDVSVPKGQQVAAAKDWFSQNAPATAGTVEGATADTAFFRAAQRELGENASMSDVLQRAQEMKVAADTHVEDLTDLLRRSVEDALRKKKR